MQHHPRHVRFLRLLLAKQLTSVSSLALGFISQLNASPGMNDSRLLDNQAITMQASNVASRVRQGNFIDFIGVQPNLAFSAFEDGSGEALLKLKRDCTNKKEQE